jgi:hypothetical protein
MRKLSLLCIAAVLVARTSSAQPTAPDEAAADVLFHEAQALFDKGRIFEACRTFEQSLQIDPKLGRLLNVAFCHEAEGRNASALIEYEQAIVMAQGRDQKDREEREAFARERAMAVRAKLAFVRLDLGLAKPSEVWVDAKAIEPERWWRSIPVDPGAHTVTVSAPGKATRVVAVNVPATTEVRVPVQLAELAVARPQDERTWRKSTGLILGGAGVVALGAGLGFGIAASVLRSDADAHCPNRKCDATGAVAIGQTRVVATLSTIGLVAGGALVATSAFFLITAPRTREAHVRVVPAVGPTFAGAGLEGTW